MRDLNRGIEFSIDLADKSTYDHMAYDPDKRDVSFPKKYLTYLPSATQSVIKNLDYMVPHNEAVGLIKEAAVERFSRSRKLNDPQAFGFHGGDPEGVSRDSLHDSAIEDRGRRFSGSDQKFESSPSVYRAALPNSTLLTQKYYSNKGNKSFPAGANTGGNDTPFGSFFRNMDEPQVSRRSSDSHAYYARARPPYKVRRSLSEILYPGVDYDKSMIREELVLERGASPETEAHELIHRGFRSLPNNVLPDNTNEFEHEYIHDLESGEDMSKYDYLIDELPSGEDKGIVAIMEKSNDNVESYGGEEMLDEEGLGSLIKTIVGSTQDAPEIEVAMTEADQRAMVREMAATAQMLRKAGAPITSEEDVEKIPMEILDQLNTILDRSPEE